MPTAVKQLLSPLASLKLTVLLLALSVMLVFMGTLAQVDQGIWDVVGGYFRSFYVYVPLQLFFPRDVRIPGELPFPGGYTIGVLMLLNLLAAHTLRFNVRAKGLRLLIGLLVMLTGGLLLAWFHNSPVPGHVLTLYGGYAGVLPLMLLGAVVYSPMVVGCWIIFGKRAGIILIHSALILLLIGEAVTARTAVETQMPIYEGTSASWAHDIREVELAVIDPSDASYDETVVVPQSMLRRSARTGQRISHPDLPFDIVVDQYLSQSRIVPIAQSGRARADATRGFGVSHVAVAAPAVSGVDLDKSIDVPSALVSLGTADGPVGRYLVSPHFQADSHLVVGQDVSVGDKTYQLSLRFRRYYRPFTLHLIRFHHDLYPGTNIPRNFASDIRLVDTQEHVDRELKIYMNNPLRYRGEIYFQSSWIPGARAGDPDRGTVLMVVRNPGWTIPYIACAMGAIGMTVQFGSGLAGFLRRRKA
ncbi:MAG: cytochrome c biogenesis protein ResB [Phycisphaerales bacterium]